MVWTLNALDFGQGRLGAILPLGQHDLQQAAGLGDRQGGGLRAHLHAQAHQEGMCRRLHVGLQRPGRGQGGVRALSAQGAAAGGGNNARIRPTGGAGAPAIIRSRVAAQLNDCSGWVAVDSNGQFECVITGATASNVALEIWA